MRSGGDLNDLGVTRERHVGRIHDRGVDRLVLDEVDELIRRLRITRRRRRDACGVEDPPRVDPARRLLHAQPELQIRIAEIVDAGDAGGVSFRHDDRHRVGGEDDRLRAGQVGLGQSVHVGRIGRGEDIGRGAIDDLVGEQVGGVEVRVRNCVLVLRLECESDVRERLGQ